MNYKKYHGKKLLVLAGASVHVKLVRAAQEMGAYVIVTDNICIEDSPAKQIADETWDISVVDVDSIVEKCRKIGVDGVIAGWIDPCQRPYFEICQRLNLNCYGTYEQFFEMTDKHAFKKMCQKYGVDVIPEFTMDDYYNKKIAFPVFVKPVDSRGSRGQSVCYNYDELDGAIKFAKSESSNGDILIEKYIKDKNEFHVTYFFINGEPHILRASDNYCGYENQNMQKVVSCSVLPSKFLDLYLDTAHKKVVNMFRNLGVKYGPVFMQGFVDNGLFRFFDPGFRFPGVDIELIFKEVFGVDFMKAMIDIAFTGKTKLVIPPNIQFLDGNYGSVLYLTVKAGTIKSINGVEDVINNKYVISYLPRCKVGDKIDWQYNVNQRLAEIDILCPNFEELLKTIEYIHKTIKASTDVDNDAIFSRFDISRLIGYK